MTFNMYWREFSRKTGVNGPLEMRRCFYHWLYSVGKITVEQRNIELDLMDENEDHLKQFLDVQQQERMNLVKTYQG